MKKINQALLLLAGITANILIACGGATDGGPSGEPYPSSDTTRAAEYKNDPDSLSSNSGTGASGR